MTRRVNPINKLDQRTQKNSLPSDPVSIVLLPYTFVPKPKMSEAKYNKASTQEQNAFNNKVKKWLEQYHNEFLSNDIAYTVNKTVGLKSLQLLNTDLYNVRTTTSEGKITLENIYENISYVREGNIIAVAIPFFQRNGVIGVNYSVEYTKKLKQQKAENKELTKPAANSLINYEEWAEVMGTIITRVCLDILKVEKLVSEDVGLKVFNKNNIQFYVPFENYSPEQRRWILDVAERAYITIQNGKKYLVFGREALNLNLTEPRTLSSEPKIKVASEEYKNRLESNLSQISSNEYRQQYDVSIVANPFTQDNVAIMSYVVEDNQDTLVQIQEVINSWIPNGFMHLVVDNIPGIHSVMSVVNKMNQCTSVEGGIKNVLEERNAANNLVIPWAQEYLLDKSKVLVYKQEKGYRITSGKIFADMTSYHVHGKPIGEFNIDEEIYEGTIGDDDITNSVLNFNVYSFPLKTRDNKQAKYRDEKLWANVLLCGVGRNVFIMYYLPQSMYLLSNQYVLNDAQYGTVYGRPFKVANKVIQDTLGIDNMPIFIQAQDINRLHNPSQAYDILKQFQNVTLFEMPYNPEESSYRTDDQPSALDNLRKTISFANRPIIASSLALRLGLIYKSNVSSGGIFLMEQPFNKDLLRLLIGRPETEVVGELKALQIEFGIDQSSAKKPIIMSYSLKVQQAPRGKRQVDNFNDIDDLAYKAYNAETAFHGATRDGSISDTLAGLLSKVDSNGNYTFIVPTLSIISKWKEQSSNPTLDGAGNWHKTINGIRVSILPNMWKKSDNTFYYPNFKADLKNAFHTDRVGYIVIDTLDASITREQMQRIIDDEDNKYGSKTITQWADEGYVVIFTGAGNYKATGEESSTRELIYWDESKETDKASYVRTEMLAQPSAQARAGKQDSYYKAYQTNQQKRSIEAFGSVEALGTQAKPWEAEKKKVIGGFVWFNSLKRTTLLYFGGYHTENGTRKYFVPTIQEMTDAGLLINPTDKAADIFTFEAEPLLSFPLQQAYTVASFRNMVKRYVQDKDLMEKIGLSPISTKSGGYKPELEPIAIYPSAPTREQAREFTEDRNRLIQTLRNISSSLYQDEINNPTINANPLLTLEQLEKNSFVTGFTNKLKSRVESADIVKKLLESDLRDGQVRSLVLAIESTFDEIYRQTQSKWLIEYNLYESIPQQLPKTNDAITNIYTALFNKKQNELKSWVVRRALLYAIRETKQSLLDQLNSKITSRSARVLVVGANYPESQVKDVVNILKTALSKLNNPIVYVLDTVGTSAIVQDYLKSAYKVQVIPYSEGVTDLTNQMITYINSQIDPSDIIVVKGEVDLNKSTRRIVNQLANIGNDRRVSTSTLQINTGRAYQVKKEEELTPKLPTIYPSIYVINEDLEGVKVPLTSEAKNTVIPYQDYKDPYDAFWIELQARWMMGMLPVMSHEKAKKLGNFGADTSFYRLPTEDEMAAETRFRKSWAERTSKAELKSQLIASITTDSSLDEEKKAAEKYLKNMLSNIIEHKSFGQREKTALDLAIREVKKQRYKSAGGFIKQTPDGIRWVVPIRVANSVEFIQPKDYNKKRNQFADNIRHVIEEKSAVRLALKPNYGAFAATSNLVDPDIGTDTMRNIDEYDQLKKKKAAETLQNIKDGTFDYEGFEVAKSYFVSYADYMMQNVPEPQKYVDILDSLITKLDVLDRLPSNKKAIFRTPLFSSGNMSLSRDVALDYIEAAAMFALYMCYLSSRVQGQQPIGLETFVLNTAPPRNSRKFKRNLETEIRPWLIKYTRILSVLYNYALGQLDAKSVPILNDVLMNWPTPLEADNVSLQAVVNEAIKQSLDAQFGERSSRARQRIQEYIEYKEYEQAYGYLVSEVFGGDVPRSLVNILRYASLKNWIDDNENDPRKGEAKQQLEKIQREFGKEKLEKLLQVGNKVRIVDDSASSSEYNLFKLLSPIVTQDPKTKENIYTYNIQKLADYGIRVLIYVYNNFQTPKNRIPMPPVNDLGNLTAQELEEIRKALDGTFDMVIQKARLTK